MKLALIAVLMLVLFLILNREPCGNEHRRIYNNKKHHNQNHHNQNHRNQNHRNQNHHEIKDLV